MAVVGRASVYVAPSFTGFQTRVGRAAKGAGQTMSGEMTKSTRGLGSRMAGAIGRGLMLAGKATAAGAGIAMGAAVVGGFKSAIAQENAQATLSGLYGSAKQATSQMGALRKVASQSPLSLKAYTDMAQSLAYMGIKGPKAAAAAKNIGAAIIGAGGGAEQMGRASDALLGMVNAGKVQLDTLNQLSDAGVPIFSGLAAHFGKSIAQVREMVTNGKVGIEDVLGVVQNATGKTFQKQIASYKQANKTLGNTFKRAATNVQDSIGRIMLPALRAITPVVQKMGAGAVKIIDRIPAAFQRAKAALSGGGGALSAFTPLITVLKGAAPALKQVGGAFTQIGRALGSALASVLPTVASSFVALAAPITRLAVTLLPPLATMAGTLARVVFPVLAAVLNAILPVLTGVVGAVARLLTPLARCRPLVYGIVSAFIAWRAAMAIRGAIAGVQAALRLQTLAVGSSTAAMRANAIAMKLQVIWYKAWTLGTRIAAAASRIFAVATRLVGIAMRSALGPVGLIITAVGLLVTGFIYAYKHSATFRKIVQGALHGVAAAGRFMWNRVLKPAFNGMVIAFKAVGRFFTAVGHGIVAIFRRIGAIARWLWVKLLRPYFAAWMKVFRTVGRVFRAVWRGFLQPVFQLFGAIVKWLFVKAIRFYFNLIKSAFRAVGALFRSIWRRVLSPTIHAFANLGKWLWAKVLRPTLNAIRSGWTAMGNLLRAIWRRVISPTIHAFASLGRWLWRNILKPTLAAIRTAWNTTAGLIRGVYNRIIRPILHAFGTAAQGAKNVAAAAFRGVRGAWSTTSSHLGRVFRGAMTGTFNAFKKAGSGMRSAFGTAVSGIGKAWSKLSDLAKKPIRFIIDTVINRGLIKGFNSLARMFGTKQIKWLPVPFRSGGYTGNLPENQPAGVVHGRENVINAPSSRKAERQIPGGLAYLNRTGKWPVGPIGNNDSIDQQASPGTGVPIQNLTGVPANLRKLARRGPRSDEKAGFGASPIAWANAHNHAMGWYRRCLAMVNAAWDHEIARFGLATARQSMNAGPRTMEGVAPAGAAGYWDTGPAGHIALSLGGNRYFSNDAVKPGRLDAVGKGVLDKWGPFRGWWMPSGKGIIGKFKGAISGVLGAIDPIAKIKSAISSAMKAGAWLSQTPFGQMAKAVPGYLLSKAGDWIKNKFSSLVGGVASWVGGSAAGLGKDQLNNAATIISVAKRMGMGDRGALIGLMTSLVESNLKNVHYGDRDSLGLFQQRASWGSAATRTNPAKSAGLFFNALKGKNWQSGALGALAQAVQVSAFPGRYAQKESQARAILAKYKKGKGYATGVNSATAGLHRIAENGPELVTRPQTRLFTGRERVDNAADTAALLSRPRRMRLDSGALDIRNGKAYVTGVVEEIVDDARNST